MVNHNKLYNLLDGKATHLKKEKEKVKNPEFLLATSRETEEVYGFDSGINPLHLDHLYHKDKNINLSRRESYYVENNSKAYVWYKNEGDIIELTFEYDQDTREWEPRERRVIRNKQKHN